MSDADPNRSSSASFFDRRKLIGTTLSLLLIAVFLMPTITADPGPVA